MTSNLFIRCITLLKKSSPGLNLTSSKVEYVAISDAIKKTLFKYYLIKGI